MLFEERKSLPTSVNNVL